MAEGYQDKRVERSKAAVLKETYWQLTQGGFGGVSIDDISRESGVAKTTIYRHWPTRAALLIDACSRMGASQEAPDLGSLRDDLLALTRDVAGQLRTAPWTRVLPSIIDAAERDSDVSAMQAALYHNNVKAFADVIARAQSRGDIAENVASTDLISTILGPLFYRRWFSKEEISDHFVELVLTAALACVGHGSAQGGVHEQPASQWRARSRQERGPAQPSLAASSW